ncbi:hypothetical protein QQS21_005802 [Conoideocrella luteorostrata]|uniref:DUF4246 domain-containing protein n=1 Tax=Conoideocrella luteorostrata TaxID=1105319 RepID=A0AAJ0CPU8_9HYPO|nr:hypothetical protein QQS21_005802 [Conoideocrella luteorostrata]
MNHRNTLLANEETKDERRKYYSSGPEKDEGSDGNEGLSDNDSKEEGDDADDDDDYDDESYGEDDNINDSSPHFNFSYKHVKSSKFFNGALRAQVIVKLTNIHLTPDEPSYDGS